ncbi:hypothetical protein UPYG_G00352740 [Umbra pygmaea]|uniref:Uncharacterized protein n=1 Tax=Umbra pygmaea TaxID=75934 RepID=A0ABD0WGG8_UMBPY
MPSFVFPKECCFPLYWNAVQTLPTWLPCIIMKMQTDHRPKVYHSSKSIFPRLGRESAELNLRRHPTFGCC